jgi:DNA mismatch repair protein MutL
LVIDLARTRMPYTCPHGRPTLIYMSFRELNKKFGREHGSRPLTDPPPA